MAFHTINLARIPEQRRLGLMPSVLRDLPADSIVVLAGPNGGGKSRLFRLFEELLAAHQSKKWPTPIEAGNPVVLHRPNTVPAIISLGSPRLGGVNYGQFQNFNPSKVKYWRDTSEEERQALNPQHGIALIDVTLGSIAYALYSGRHPDHSKEPIVERAARRAQKFCDLVRALTGLVLSYTIDDGFPMPLIDGRPLKSGELSNGQVVLLGWAIALERATWRLQHGTSRDSSLIVTADEPELYLHPKAAIDVVQRLLAYLRGRGQLWVATHSPTIVAGVSENAALYHVAGGAFEFASSNPTTLIEGLVGGEEERHRLRDMMDDADRVAFYKFAAECLRDAIVVGEADGSDPQAVQVMSVLEGRSKRRILDYGSGQGRLASALAESLSEAQRETIDYHTYDAPEYDDGRQDRLCNLRKIYPAQENVEGRISNDISDFCNDQRVDLVILCNVLHEIEPQKWRKTFCEILNILRDDGQLLLLEDQELAVGELPNKTGFIVLNLGEVRTLLGTSSKVQPIQKSDSSRRCSAIRIEREALSSCASKDTFTANLRQTLELVKSRALEMIRRTRDSGDSSYRSGRAHARAAMLLANVEIALGD